MRCQSSLGSSNPPSDGVRSALVFDVLLAPLSLACYRSRMNARSLFIRLMAALQRLNRRPAMTGIPPSARQIPSHPELHALDFAERYAEPLDYHAGQVMIDLGIPRDQIGASAPLHGIRCATFHWRERTGGGVSPEGRLTLDSGIFNTELLTKDYGEQVAKIWREMRLKPRMEATTAHELAEYETQSHVEALAAAANTRLPVSHQARELLRAMERGWKWR
jgi:hypothetical protein